MKFNYTQALTSSFSELFKKPVLLLPFVFLFIVEYVFALVLTANAAQITVGSVIAFVVYILVAVFISATALMLFRKTVDGKKTSLTIAMSEGWGIYGKLILLSILLFIVFVVPALILLILYGVLGESVTAAIILGILYFVFAVYAILNFLFAQAAITDGNNSAKASAMKSIAIFGLHKKHVIMTLLTILIFNVIAIIIVGLVAYALTLWNYAVGDLVSSLLMIPISGMNMLFLFKAYKANKK